MAVRVKDGYFMLRRWVSRAELEERFPPQDTPGRLAGAEAAREGTRARGARERTHSRPARVRCPGFLLAFAVVFLAFGLVGCETVGGGKVFAQAVNTSCLASPAARAKYRAAHVEPHLAPGVSYTVTCP